MVLVVSYGKEEMLMVLLVECAAVVLLDLMEVPVEPKLNPSCLRLQYRQCPFLDCLPQLLLALSTCQPEVAEVVEHLDRNLVLKKLLDEKLELLKSVVLEVLEDLDCDWSWLLTAVLEPWVPEVRKVEEFPGLEEQVATAASEEPVVLVASSH